MSRRNILYLLLAALLLPLSSANAGPKPPGYLQAEQIFEGQTIDERISVQVFLTAAGYWNAVPTEHFSQRLFAAVKRFQNENGLVADGVPSKGLAERVSSVARPMLNEWGFRKVNHPINGQSLWVPMGLGLTSQRTKNGVDFADPAHRVAVSFNYYPATSPEETFARVAAMLESQGTKIHFKTIKDGWFVISSTSSSGLDGYLRYHKAGNGILGFNLLWNNSNGNISAERIAVLMSASIWSEMTGAAFIAPPHLTTNVALKPPSDPESRDSEPKRVPEAPHADDSYSSGSGFFVSTDGSFVTNAHVLEKCSLILVKSSDGGVSEGHLFAIDTQNDLALVRTEVKPRHLARLRVGVRLGEGVAAFGYPHTDLLSSSGNFTLGNVTALTGIGDDSRFFQVSAPVQSGNSGGPLLDNYGNLIGVVTAKLNALKLAANGGDLAQNVNFAIKSAILATFLDANRVNFSSGSSGSKALESADLAEEAKGISGFVACKQ